LRIWRSTVSWAECRPRTRVTYLEGAEQALIHAHHGTGIVELAAVVGGAEQRDELALGEELVTILDDLVGTADEVHVVFLQEARDDIWAEREGDTAIVLGPAGDVLVGVRPQEIAEEAAVGDLATTRQQLETRRQAEPIPHTSVGRMTRRICSIEFRSGLRPPCMVKIFSSMMAAMGRQLKQSVKVFHSLML
jgi:hypothetical protein